MFIIRLYVSILASPCMTVVWQGFWNSDYVVLKSSIHSSASPRSVAVWLGFWSSDHVVLKSNINCSALPCTVVVWLTFWNSDHVVLELNVRTSASPQPQQPDWGLRVTQNTYFSLIAHSKQLLLVIFCDTTTGIWAIFWTDRQTEAEWQTDMEVKIVI